MRRCSPLVVIAAISGGFAASETKAAEERLVMPYACHMRGDRIAVRPAESTSYEIIGRREQQPFTTCDSGGDRCSTLMIHRFSIACDGVRVPWMHVAAAVLPRKPARHWIDSGRMRILRLAERSRADARACADKKAREGSAECLPWSPAPEMERITLPAGFAPLGLASARIEAGPPSAPAVVSDGSVAAASVAAAAQAPPAAPSLAAASAKIAAPAGVAKPTAPPAPPVHDRIMVVEARDLSEAPIAPQTRDRMLWAWLGGIGVLGLIAAAGNRLTKERRAVIVRNLRRRQRRAAVSMLARLKKREESRAPEAEAQPAAAPEDPALANAAWAAATLLDQIEQAVQGLGEGTPLRDVLEEELTHIHQRLVATRAAALDGGAPGKAAAQYRALVRELERVKRIANSAAASLAGARPVMAMPVTKAEAYQLLGVNPDVNEGILKKLVDALRMTWHPDHARSEHDRVLREERIKQINVAWELICDKRQTMSASNA